MYQSLKQVDILFVFQGNFLMSATETLGAEIRQLCEHLEDPTYSPESKAVAAELIRMGVQAMKVAKEARVKQVLMEQMYEDMNRLKLQNDAMRQTINQQQYVQYLYYVLLL